MFDSKCRELGHPEGREGDVPSFESQEGGPGGSCVQKTGRAQSALLSGRGAYSLMVNWYLMFWGQECVYVCVCVCALGLFFTEDINLYVIYSKMFY